MSRENMLKDEDEVEFIASAREDGKVYSVTVLCENGMSEQEFAACLVAFANDINNGESVFDEHPSMHEQSMQ